MANVAESSRPTMRRPVLQFVIQGVAVDESRRGLAGANVVGRMYNESQRSGGGRQGCTGGGSGVDTVTVGPDARFRLVFGHILNFPACVEVEAVSLDGSRLTGSEVFRAFVVDSVNLVDADTIVFAAARRLPP